MSISKRASAGDKGSDLGYRGKVLKGLSKIAENTGASGLSAAIAALTTAVINHQEMEIILVRDTGNADAIVAQINEYDETTQTWSLSYQNPDGTSYTPTGPLEYLDASQVLNLILTELLDQGLSLDAMVTDLAAIEVELLDQGISLDAVVTDLAAIEVELLDQGVSLDALVVDAAAIEAELLDQGTSLDALVTDAAAIEVELLDQGISLDAMTTDLAAIEVELLDQGVSLDAVVTDLAAIETELLDQGTTLDAIETELLDQGTELDTLATPVTGLAVNGPLRDSGIGSVTAGKRRISIMNAGAAAADVNGGTNNLEPGETVTWSADGLRDTLAAVSYDGTGTTLVITSVG